MYKQTFEFNAIPSGDFDAFTFAVNKETFKQIKDEEPDKYDKNDFHKNRYNIYPDDLFMYKLDKEGIIEYLKREGNKEYKIKIEIEEI